MSRPPRPSLITLLTAFATIVTAFGTVAGGIGTYLIERQKIEASAAHDQYAQTDARESANFKLQIEYRERFCDNVFSYLEDDTPNMSFSKDQLEHMNNIIEKAVISCTEPPNFPVQQTPLPPIPVASSRERPE